MKYNLIPVGKDIVPTVDKPWSAKISMTRLLSYLSILLFSLLLAVFPQSRAAAETAASPLLLLFDVELQEDNDALTQLNFQEFSSFFLTGEFAGKFPETVKKLSDQGTIGVFSKAYSLLKTQGLSAAKGDLTASQSALEKITGMCPVWLRVPSDQVDRDLFSLAGEVGFRFDASESEQAVSQSVLGEFPISTNSTDRILFSDFDLFVTYGLDDQMALDLLKENYLYRKESGRPFVMLLHPTIIVQHAAVLQDFAKYVKQQGGACLSLDQFFSRGGQQQERSVGIQVDPGLITIDMKEMIRNLLEFGVTDVFVPVMDRDGNHYFASGGEPMAEPEVCSRFELLLKSLAAAGIKTHLSISALRNHQAVVKNKQAAMVDQHGLVSDLWLSPSSEKTKTLLIKNLKTLVKKYNVAGIHLTDLLYPGLNYDYSQAAVKQFEKVNNITVQRGNTAEQLLTEHLAAWTAWRTVQIEQLVSAARETVKASRPDLLLSATLPARSLQDAKERLQSGCDGRLLASYLDMVVMRPSLNEFLIATFSMPRITAAGRSAAGLKPLLFQIPLDRGKNWSEYGVKHLLDSMKVQEREQLAGIVYPFYDQLLEDPVFSGENFATIFSLTRIYIQGDYETDKEQKITDPVPTPVVSELTENSAGEIKESWPAFLYKIDKNQVYEVVLRFAPLVVSLVLTLFVLLLFVYFLFVKKVFSKKNSMSMEMTTIIDWQSMDQSILDEQISGKLVHSVSRLLQTYKPQSAARYRIGLLLHLVDEGEQHLAVDELGQLPVNIPDWEIISRKYLNETMLHGYVVERDNLLYLTESGEKELFALRAEGFNAGQWIFVEQRMQEKLVATCPLCGTRNVGQWYTREFVCNGCKAAVTYRECNSIERIPLNGDSEGSQ